MITMNGSPESAPSNSSSQRSDGLPSYWVIKGISWLYRSASFAKLISVIASRTRLPAVQITDYFVVTRLVLSLGLLLLPAHSVFSVLSAVLLLDVLLAHAAHLFDDSLGSGGPRKRHSAGRSLLIALTNVVVIAVVFAVLYRQFEGCTRAHAIAVSGSTLTTQGLVQPQSTFARALALLQGLTTLFMITVVLSTVLAGLRPRAEIHEQT